MILCKNELFFSSLLRKLVPVSLEHCDDKEYKFVILGQFPI
jgi:hypothetical protein